MLFTIHAVGKYRKGGQYSTTPLFVVNCIGRLSREKCDYVLLLASLLRYLSHPLIIIVQIWIVFRVESKQPCLI